MNGKRILITGAAGFVGKVLRQKAKDAGADVIGWTRVEADLADAGQVRRALSEACPDVIVHLAGSTDRSRDLNAMHGLLRHNVQCTLNLVEAVYNYGPLPVVHVGTLEEYGATSVPFVETQAALPRSPYAASKLAAGALCTLAGGTHVRMGLVYGPAQSEAFFIPQLMRAALEGRSLAMTEGRQTRDFIHVDEAAEGLMRIATTTGLQGQVVNLCSGQACSLKEAVTVLQKVLGRPLDVEFGALPYREGEVFDAVGSPEKLEQATGWKPRMTLEEGLRKLVESYA